MVKPSLTSLMEKENINRYTLVVATAKAARKITDEYIAQRDYAEKYASKDSDRGSSVINEKYRDEKAVQNAIEELYDGEYQLVHDTLPYGQGCGRADDGADAEDETADGGDADSALDGGTEDAE